MPVKARVRREILNMQRTTAVPRSTAPGYGWTSLLIEVFARAYLVFMLALAAFALLPSLFGWHGSVVQSGSMEPHISAGDIVLLSDFTSDQPVPMGGVVEFRSVTGSNFGPERLLLHRIVGANPDGTLITAGDANVDVDSTPMEREQITGQARLLVPYVGLPSIWLGTGNLPALAIWSVLTLAALAVTAWSIPVGPREGGKPRSNRPGPNPSQEPTSNAEDHPAMAAALSRRSLLSAVPLLALPAAAGAAFGARPVSAFFTGLTASAGNSWQVAASFVSRMFHNYRTPIMLDKPWAYYPLDEAPGVYVARDFSGNTRNANYSLFGVTNSVPGALVNETNFAITLEGSATATFATPGPMPGPQVFTIELWFRTGSGQGGELASFGNARTGTSGSYDRNLYLGSDGKLNFGVYPGVTRVITSPLSYNNSAWHHVAATLGPTGMALYVNGQLVGSNTASSAQVYSGYWRIGGDNLAGWPNRPLGTYFAGSIDEVAIYSRALTSARITTHYQAALASTTGNYALEVMDDVPSHYYHFEEGVAGTIIDSSGNRQDSTYPTRGVTYGVPGPLVKMNNRAAQFDGSSASLVTATRHDNPQTFSVEAWFRTVTTRGGQIIGFANSTSITTSTRHDRTIYMLNTGNLVFGVRPSSTRRVIFTENRYNDGQWHHVVATLSASGMFLYVDGAVAALDSRYTGADPYNGWWQTGAGQLANWPSRPTSNYFAGTLDEVAIYTQALSPAQVRAHHAAR